MSIDVTKANIKELYKIVGLGIALFVVSYSVVTTQKSVVLSVLIGTIHGIVYAWVARGRIRQDMGVEIDPYSVKSGKHKLFIYITVESIVLGITYLVADKWTVSPLLAVLTYFASHLLWFRSAWVTLIFMEKRFN